MKPRHHYFPSLPRHLRLAAASWVLFAISAHASPMLVQRLDGWGNFIPGMGYDLEVTVGNLHPNCSFEPSPPSMQWKTLSGFGGNSDGFLQIGAYYLFGPWESQSQYAQLYPWATLTPSSSHGPGKNGHWRVSCGGGGTILPAFGTGTSRWRSSGRSVSVTVPQIVNRSGTRVTGDLLVWVVVNRNRSVLARGGGLALASVRYRPLPAGYMYSARTVRTSFRRPPRGRYSSALVLAEWTGRWTPRDSRVFGGTVLFR
jgi:hypothetical protein